MDHRQNQINRGDGDNVKPLDPEKAREELERILSEQQYQAYYRSDQNVLLSWLDWLQNWLYDVLKKYFPETMALSNATEWIAYLILGVVILLLFLFLFMLGSRFVRTGSFQEKPIGTASELAWSVREHLAEAERLADKEDFQAALRHAFLAFILYLDQTDWIDAKPWKTNGDYYDEIEGHSREKAQIFYLLALKFEETMYGGRHVNKDHYDTYRNQIEQLINDHSNMVIPNRDGSGMYKGGIL